ncbi:MAG: DMT family transporter [Desulfomonilia bacterium]|jgi:drug/metabolite transporter (DMT)-like permease
MTRKTALIPTMSLILAMILWASSFIALKLAFQAYDPMAVIFGRMAVGSLFALFFFRRFHTGLPRGRDLLYLAGMLLCEPCLYFLFEAKAVQNTTASQAGMITALLPLMVAVGAAMFLRERITGRTLTGFIIAIFGACLLSWGGDPSPDAPNPALGNFLEFVAMICATGYTLLLKKLTERYHPFFLTAMQAFAGALFYLPVMVLTARPLPVEFVPVPALSVVYLGIAVTMGAYGLYNFGVSRIPASQASAFVNLIPVFTVILGWMVLGESFTALQYPAALLVFAGVFLSQARPGDSPVSTDVDQERGDLRAGGRSLETTVE